MKVKKKDTLLLQSNNVGSFHCDQTLLELPRYCPFGIRNLPLYILLLAYRPPQSQIPSKVTTT